MHTRHMIHGCMHTRDMIHHMCGTHTVTCTHVTRFIICVAPTWQPFMWHDPFTCETWRIPLLIHMCDMTHLWVWYDSFMCDMTHSWVWHDSFMSATPRSCASMWNDAFTCETWLVPLHIHTCGMTHSCVWPPNCTPPCDIECEEARVMSHYVMSHYGSGTSHVSLWDLFTFYCDMPRGLIMRHDSCLWDLLWHDSCLWDLFTFYCESCLIMRPLRILLGTSHVSLWDLIWMRHVTIECEEVS